MTQPEFFNLNIADRGNFLWANGHFLAHRDYYGYRIALYVIPGLFYVEVWIFIETNEIEKVEPLVDKQNLDLYLNAIDLKKLMDQYPFKGSNE